MLYRRKVQLIASERMALSSRCLPRCGCTLCHQVQHTNALVHLEMLALSHTGFAAQQQVCSRKTTASVRAETESVSVTETSETPTKPPVAEGKTPKPTKPIIQYN